MCKSTKIECPRCGGSGETEFTNVVYGICFMCKGQGMVYPKRVGELEEKAKVRKANKQAKYYQELKESREKEEAYWNKVYAEITRRNKVYFDNYKCAIHDNAMRFYKQINTISEHLGFDSNTTEAEVREMFEDYFKDEAWGYRLEISKYTLKYHNFCWLDLDGRKTDLTECGHKVQNLFSRY